MSAEKETAEPQAVVKVLRPDESAKLARVAALQRLQERAQAQQRQGPLLAKYHTMLRVLPREAVRLRMQGEGWTDAAVAAFFVSYGADKERPAEAGT